MNFLQKTPVTRIKLNKEKRGRRNRLVLVSAISSSCVFVDLVNFFHDLIGEVLKFVLPKRCLENNEG